MSYFEGPKPSAWDLLLMEILMSDVCLMSDVIISSPVIGRCGSAGLYSMGSHWSESTWARLVDCFYSTNVDFPCTSL